MAIEIFQYDKRILSAKRYILKAETSTPRQWVITTILISDGSTILLKKKSPSLLLSKCPIKHPSIVYQYLPGTTHLSV